nr:radical SAM additional 4Fe4S-binding SPASM domain (rSAM_more_4Fe4S) [uncultured Mediterranean phage uvMED]
MSKNIPITAVDQYDFLEHRREQEKLHWSKQENVRPLDSILTVEINTTELCNRTCVFCPRHDPAVFPNRNLHLTVKGAQTIAEELGENGFNGKISFSGFGENLLNPNFVEIVKEFHHHLPTATLECNTNGDKLTEDYIHRLYRAGLNLLYINLYDGIEQMAHFESMLTKVPEDRYKFRMHWGDFEKHGLILNNRSGVMDWVGIEETDISSLKGKPCHYPFYKMFVDWNGDVLFCSNDWGREHVVGNLLTMSLHDVWFSKPMTKIRKRLMKGDRSHSPCNKCSVDGSLFGKPSFDLVKEYYESSNNRK